MHVFLATPASMVGMFQPLWRFAVQTLCCLLTISLLCPLCAIFTPFVCFADAVLPSHQQSHLPLGRLAGKHHVQPAQGQLMDSATVIDFGFAQEFDAGITTC